MTRFDRSAGATLLSGLLFPHQLLDRVLDWLPGRTSAAIDLRRPHLWDSWGGPLNGQHGRQHLIRDLLGRCPFVSIVETGTFRGTTTQFFADVSGVVVRSCDVNLRYLEFARRRLANREVELELADSRSFLSRLTDEGATLFYLDAHWNDELPLQEELRIIIDKWRDSVIIIDDFRVVDDPGYRYDDYGPGRVLDESILPMQKLSGWGLAYPSLHSDEEDGARRGCAVLVSPDVVPRLAMSPLLRMRPL